MYKCNQCGKEFSEKYSKWSDGNFCCKECARKYSSCFVSDEGRKKQKKALEDYYKTHSYISSTQGRKQIDKKTFNKIKKLDDFDRKKYIVVNKEKEYAEIICPVCCKKFFVLPSQKSKRKFCSGTCRNHYNNQFINGSRSKAEIQLYNRLKNEFPQWNIISNDRKILNGKELDIYIPNINFAIEWNGIYHYKNIRNDLLENVQRKDAYKIEECQKLNIDLYVVKDLTSSKKFIENEIEQIIHYINKKYIQEW